MSSETIGAAFAAVVAERAPRHRPRALDYSFAVATVVAATGACFALQRFVPVATLALVFVTAVLVVAVRSRTSIATFSAVLSSLAYNYFFTEPRFTLRIADSSDLAAVLAFLVAALVVGQLASRQMEQSRLEARLEKARIEAERERLRSALLSSISHDLRSPLSAVIGAATSLSAYGETISPADRLALLESIRDEGERLDRYIQNLLDMTRLGSGPLKLDRDWVGLDEILSTALTRLRRLYPDLPVERDLSPGLPPLYVHPALVEQALFNVLENAAKFSPPGTAVSVRAARDEDRLRIDVVDRGPGIPEEERKRVFDQFFTAPRGDRGARGTGLGLTIVRGMIGAHGGRVEALAGPGGSGTTIRIMLPLSEPPAAAPAESEP